jgi:hypothetical protein
LVEPAVERILRALTVIQKPHKRPHPRTRLLGYLSNNFQANRQEVSLIAGNIVVRTWTDYTFRKNFDIHSQELRWCLQKRLTSRHVIGSGRGLRPLADLAVWPASHRRDPALSRATGMNALDVAGTQRNLRC